ncbi:26S proteasome regulatory subunit S14 [Cavenderia fasciculata]|uniref:26S proteasome regulatory subunit S14 n=1 Tax=Cavenderia fasciculata TaxID=261658 RepID=F4PGC3_CACFS|nr:26S proteasome regulatory subunit S14 [Cavenderia fasciculata]EGG24757.1 26S proteasome regulatory subunit S14 [Cavenderia fasciculata]|eukprot:XP_004362608.1 26S proteasome regulatory subunit S14 [Cavenderia fasciculata]
MPLDFSSTESNFTQFKKLVEGGSTDTKKINELLVLLKIAIIQASIPTEKDHNQQIVKETLLVREILECGALYSIKQKDIKAFDRFYAQLTPYYYDFQKYIQPSPLQYNIIGLHLMKLLATHNTPRFHAELEIIPDSMLDNPFIKYPLLVEKSITEGSYQKVLSSRSQVPSEHYLVFIDLLSDSMKEDIANCSEKSFKYLSLNEAQQLLQFNPQQLNDFIVKRGWKVQGDKIIFQSGSSSVEIPSQQLIAQTLHYAKELERIV